MPKGKPSSLAANSQAEIIEKEEAILNLYHFPFQDILIGLPTLQGITYVLLKDILFLKGESAQTSLHMTDHKRFMVNRTLKDCEEKLKDLGFCRIHKSYIVNINHIRKYTKGDGRSLELSDGTHLDMARGYKENVLNKLRTL